MTAEAASEDLTGPAVDRVPGVTGHVVLVRDTDETGTDAVGLWHVSPSGVPVGAWVRPVPVLARRPAAADELLRLTSHRAVFDWDLAAATRILRLLARWAGRDRLPEPVGVPVPELLLEMELHRHVYAAAVERYRSRLRSRPAPLEWRRDLPRVATWYGFVSAVRLPRPPGVSRVAGRALHLAKAAAWLFELWHQTETARTRRRYLVETFGPATTLPPGWLARLRAAEVAGAARPPAGPAPVHNAQDVACTR